MSHDLLIESELITAPNFLAIVSGISWSTSNVGHKTNGRTRQKIPIDHISVIIVDPPQQLHFFPNIYLFLFILLITIILLVA